MPKINDINNGIFKNREELVFFIKNNRFAVRDLLEKSPEFRDNIQRVLEGEIVGNKINSSAIVQIASSFDDEELRNPLTNALTVNSKQGQSFFNLCTDFLKEKIKNPFVKLDEKYLEKIKLKIENEEELELELKEKIEKENKIKHKDSIKNIEKVMQHSVIMNIKAERLMADRVYKMKMRELSYSIQNNYNNLIDIMEDFEDFSLRELNGKELDFIVAFGEGLRLSVMKMKDGSIDESLLDVAIMHASTTKLYIGKLITTISTALESGANEEDITNQLKASSPETIYALEKAGLTVKDLGNLDKINDSELLEKAKMFSENLHEITVKNNKIDSLGEDIFDSIKNIISSNNIIKDQKQFNIFFEREANSISYYKKSFENEILPFEKNNYTKFKEKSIFEELNRFKIDKDVNTSELEVYKNLKDINKDKEDNINRLERAKNLGSLLAYSYKDEKINQSEGVAIDNNKKLDDIEESKNPSVKPIESENILSQPDLSKTIQENEQEVGVSNGVINNVVDEQTKISKGM